MQACRSKEISIESNHTDAVSPVATVTVGAVTALVKPDDIDGGVGEVNGRENDGAVQVRTNYVFVAWIITAER